MVLQSIDSYLFKLYLILKYIFLTILLTYLKSRHDNINEMETRDLMMAPVPVKLRPDQYCGKIIDHTRVSRRVGRVANRLPKEALITYLKPRHDSINEDGNTQTRVRRRKNVYQKQSGSCSTSKTCTGEPDQGTVVKNSSTVIIDGIPFVDLLPVDLNVSEFAYFSSVNDHVSKRNLDGNLELKENVKCETSVKRKSSHDEVSELDLNYNPFVRSNVKRITFRTIKKKVRSQLTSSRFERLHDTGNLDRHRIFILVQRVCRLLPSRFVLLPAGVDNFQASEECPYSNNISSEEGIGNSGDQQSKSVEVLAAIDNNNGQNFY